MVRFVLASLFAVSAAPAFALPVVSATGITLGVTGGTLGVGPRWSIASIR